MKHYQNTEPEDKLLDFHHFWGEDAYVCVYFSVAVLSAVACFNS